MVTHRERWARLRSHLWQPPRARGEQPHERAVGPLELFYDLAVVVLVAQDSRHLALHLTWRGLGQFAAMFTLAWIAWVNGSLHHVLAGHDDARGRSTFVLLLGMPWGLAVAHRLASAADLSGERRLRGRPGRLLSARLVQVCDDTVNMSQTAREVDLALFTRGHLRGLPRPRPWQQR